MLDVFLDNLATRRVIAARRVHMLTWPSWARLKRTRKAVSERLRAAHNSLCLPMQSGPKSPAWPSECCESPFKPILLDSGAARE